VSGELDRDESLEDDDSSEERELFFDLNRKKL